MKRIGLIVAVVAVFLVAAWAQEPLRDVNQPQRPIPRGGSGPLQVEVTNLPFAEDGNVGVHSSFTNVIDLLDEEIPAGTGSGVFWVSDPFTVQPFHTIAIRAERTFTDAGPTMSCTVAWRFLDNEEFAKTLEMNIRALMTGPVTLGLSTINPVNGTSARVECEANSSFAGSLIDVKVMLRRE